MNDKSVTVDSLRLKVRNFIVKRDWGQFHSPKNVSMSIAIEAAELMEQFQWLSCEQSKELKLNKEKMNEIKDEIADIAIYLFDLCNVLDVDLSKAVRSKMFKNNKKYPASLVKGKSHKYTHYR